MVAICGAAAGLCAFGQGAALPEDQRVAGEQLQRDAYAMIIRADLARDEKKFDEAVELYVAAQDMWSKLGSDARGGVPQDVERNMIHCKNELKSLMSDADLRKRYGEKIKDRLSDSAARPQAAATPVEEAKPSGRPDYSEKEMRRELERLRAEMFEATRREAMDSRKRREDDAAKMAHEAEKVVRITEDAKKESESARREMEAARKQSEAARKQSEAAKKQSEEASREKAAGAAAAKAARKQLDDVSRKYADLQKQKIDLERKLAKMGEVEQTAESAKVERAATEKLLESIDRDNKNLVVERRNLEKRVDQLEDSLLAAEIGKKVIKKAPQESKPPAGASVDSDRAGEAASRAAENAKLANDVRVADDLKTADAVAAEGGKLMREGRSEKAYELVMYGLAKSPDNPQLQVMLGTLHVQAGRFKEAVDLMVPLVAGEQGTAKSRVVLGAAYFGMGKYDEARVELEMAMGLDPDLSEAKYNFAQLLLHTNPPDPVRAGKYYKDAVGLGATPDPALEAAIDKLLSDRKK